MWRTVCIGHPSGCMKKRCRYVNAPNGAVCDVSLCIQGLCWGGVCMGGGPATCPEHPEKCMQVGSQCSVVGAWEGACVGGAPGTCPTTPRSACR
jgi:hypothetical protein